MAKTVTIELSEAIKTHGGATRTVVLREPSARHLWEYGEPTKWAYMKDGFAVQVENTEAIKSYIEGCVVEPSDPLLLEQVCLKDAMRIKEAVLGFFSEEPLKNSTSSSAPSSSIPNSGA